MKKIMFVTLLTMMALMIGSCAETNIRGGAETYPPSNCIDSDGGINFAQRGEIRIQGIKTVEDVCVDDLLHEYSCPDQMAMKPDRQDHHCTNGCTVGACK